MIWHTAAEVARKVNRDPCTVRRAAVAGDLHGHQPMRGGLPVAGSRWSFAADAVDAWVQGHDPEAQRVKCGCALLRPVRIAG